MTGSSEPSLTEQLSKVIHQDDGSHTSTTQETSSSSSRSSSSTSSLLGIDNHKSSRDHLHHDHHDDDLNDLWCRRQQRQRRRRNNSWDTTSLSGTTTLESLSPTTGSDHSTTSTTNNNNNNHMPLACPLVTRDDYASRRDQRLAALRASRQERLQQKASQSITQIMGSSSLMCMEDHPYYLAQQEQKLQQLKDKVDQEATRTTATTTTPVSTSNRTIAKAKILPEMHISKDLLEELTCAYQLIHRQRLYLQHLIQQQDAMQQQQQQERTRSLRRSQSSCSSSEAAAATSSLSSMIQQLQSQLIQLEHAKVETEFILYNRLTHDAMEYEDRLKHLEIKVEYWQLRSRNERESYRQDLQQAKMRIQELEQALQQQQQQQQAEASIPSLSLPTSPGKHGAMNCQKSNVDSLSLVAAHDVFMAVDNNNNPRGGGGSDEEVAVSSPKSLLPLFRPRSLSSDAVLPQQQSKEFQTRPPNAKPYSGYTVPSLSQADLIKSAMNNQHKKPKRFGVF